MRRVVVLLRKLFDTALWNIDALAQVVEHLRPGDERERIWELHINLQMQRKLPVSNEDVLHDHQTGR